MNKIIFIVFILTGINCYSQKLTCSDFKNGTFWATTSEPVELNWKIVRKGNKQTEIITELPKELIEAGFPAEPIHAIINWIDDCTYRLAYDESKSTLSESQKLINSLGGILTELVKIEGKCFYYKSTLKFEGNEQVINGSLCVKSF